MVPPKDPYIKVRVLDDIGNVVLSDQSANLARHAILFLRRIDAEQYIAQVNLLHVIALSCGFSMQMLPNFSFNKWSAGINGRADRLTQVT